MQPIPIIDPDDPRIAAYRDIRDRDLKGRQDRFVAEGKVVLNVLFTARRFEVESVLLLENRVAGMADTLARIPADVPVYAAKADVLDRIAGFHMHRGVLAIGKRRTADEVGALLGALPRGATVVAAIGIANHDNVGAIFRNAAAFGADAVLLDATSCDPLYRKAIRVSVGAVLKVPFAIAGTNDLVAALDGEGFAQVALSPAGAIDIGALRAAERIALHLGAEGPGLPADLMARMTTARIAMADGFDSLNVAAASAIALHHLMQRRKSGPVAD